MLNLKKVVVYVCSISMLGFLWISCKSDDPPASPPTSLNTYTVQFDTRGGTPAQLPEAIIVRGQKVPRPADPTKQDSLFVGWFSDPTLATRFDFNTPISKNLTLYAKWTIQTYTVHFETNGGSPINDTTLPEKSTLTKPIDPKKQDSLFAGWYTEPSFQTLFDFKTKITADITLYAKWKEVTFSTSLTFIPPNFSGLDATKEETYEYNDGKYLLECNSTNPARMTMKAKLELLPSQKANKVRIALKGGDTVLVTDDGSYYNLPAIAPNEKYTLLYEAKTVGDNTFTLRLKNGSGVERQVVQTLTVKKSTFKVVPKGNKNILYTDKTLILITIEDPNPKSKFVWSVTSNKEPLPTIHFPQGEQTGDRFYYQSAGEDGVHRISVKGRRLNDGVIVDSFVKIQINDPRFSIEAPVLSNNDLHINDSSEVTFDVIPNQSGTLHNFEIALVSNTDQYTLHSLKPNSTQQYTINSSSTPQDNYTWFSLSDIAQVAEYGKYKLKLKTKSVPGEGIKFIINVRNGNQSLEKLPVDESVTFDVKDAPLSFTSGQKEANGNEKLSIEGLANVPTKVKFTNTTNYPQGRYTWSVLSGGGSIDQDGNFVITSAESYVDVTIRLSEANTGQVKDVTYRFFLRH